MIDKVLLKQLFILLSSSILFACASSESSTSTASSSEVSGRSDCISQSSIRDYKVLDDANLIVTEGVSRTYHVELMRRAHGLRFSQAIGFDSTTGRICGRFDELLYDSSLGMDRVPITSVRRLSPEQEEELLIRFGIKEPEQEQTRRPNEVEGAEVEELD